MPVRGNASGPASGHSPARAGGPAAGPPDRTPTPDPPRLAWRKEMRVRVLDAARELTCASGWDGVSLSAVAAKAEVSRPSVYKEFGNRAGLGRALVVREAGQVLEGVAHVLGSPGRDAGASLEAAVLFVLTETGRNPLVRAVVTAARNGSDSLLPYLTARPDPVFDTAQDLLRAWLAERFPGHDEGRVHTAADVAVRMTLSHLVLPTWQPPDAAERLAHAVLVTLGEQTREPGGGEGAPGRAAG